MPETGIASLFFNFEILDAAKFNVHKRVWRCFACIIISQGTANKRIALTIAIATSIVS